MVSCVCLPSLSQLCMRVRFPPRATTIIIAGAKWADCSMAPRSCDVDRLQTRVSLLRLLRHTYPLLSLLYTPTTFSKSSSDLSIPLVFFCSAHYVIRLEEYIVLISLIHWYYPWLTSVEIWFLFVSTPCYRNIHSFNM